VTELAEKRRRNTSATAAATSQPKRLQREREREREGGANREAGAALFFYWRNEKFENGVILEDFVKFSKLPDF
jgi:hypothetical protein